MTPEAPAAEAAVTRALAAHQRDDFVSAERDYRLALETAPTHPVAVHYLGLLLHQRDRHPDSLSLLLRSIELDPSNAMYRNNLASAFKELGRTADAERLYQEALTLKPDYVDAYLNLGLLYATQGDHQRALTCCEQALHHDANSWQAWLNRGLALYELARESEALDCYRSAERLAAGDAGRLLSLAGAWREAGELQEARACLQQALALRPDDAEIHDSLGTAFSMLGELAAAERHYRTALRLKPAYSDAYHNLIGVTKLKPQDAAWPGLMALAERSGLQGQDAVFTQFTLGKVFDTLGEYDRAFGHFLEGNRLKRDSINYDEAGQRRFFEDFIRYFDADFLHARAAAGLADPRPVFIVGMSRSGTTLVEQILASHPQVEGAGEINTLRNCLRLELPPGKDDYALPRQLAALPVDALRRAGGRYTQALDRYSQAGRVTNKLPGNMALVGMIHLLFPHARIIHVQREPLDTCLSCFTMLFTHGHAFSYELSELGRFYRMYAALMEGWRKLLPPGRMLEVRYEELVADFDAEARRLVSHCGLPWDDACLDFHSQQRAVKTASLAQVRRPIYASSVGRWRNYERHLAPLRAALLI
jgi:tetratricopeptide (TPR) repeat protein